MILAGDIGATKTYLALFDGAGREPLHLASYRSREYSGLEEMVQAFLAEHPGEIEGACFGIPGPVREGRCADTTNLAWPVDSRRLAGLIGLPRVCLLNDVEANAWGILTLGPEDFAVLNEGDPAARGNAAVISAGTGLGEAGLYWDGERHHVFASEGGHADFAPRDELQVELHRFLAAEVGHVSYERVCSGLGIVNLYRFLLQHESLEEPDWYREAEDRGSAIAIAGAQGDDVAGRALDLLCSIYGAEAGNLALKVLAVGGVYLGGGIAPKLLPRLGEGAFMRAFTDKGRFEALLERIPVRVVLNDETALLGAALRARLA